MSSRPEALSEKDLQLQLSDLEGWTIDDGKLCKNFVFEDFVRAFSFMAATALMAEKLDHHPEWSNVYNKVRVSLITHDVAKNAKPALTHLDLELARFMNSL